MGANDFRGFYMKVMEGLSDDHGMSSGNAEALWEKHRDLMVEAYENGMAPTKASDMLATQDAREAHEPGTRWSKELAVAFDGESDPNDKWAQDYDGRPVWDFFDDVTETLPPDEAIECIPARYMDAFKDYCASYGIKLVESLKSEEGVGARVRRDIENAVYAYRKDHDDGKALQALKDAVKGTEFEERALRHVDDPEIMKNFKGHMDAFLLDALADQGIA